MRQSLNIIEYTLRKALKYIIISFLLLLLVAVFGLWALSYPSVQTRVLQRTCLWLSEKTGASIEAEMVDIAWPNQVFLGKVDIKEPSGRPFVQSDSLYATVDFRSLFDSKLAISEVSLYGTRVFLEKTDSSWNYDFFTKAFPKSEKESTGTSLFMDVKNTPVFLENCQFTYHDIPKNIEIDAYLGLVDARFDSIDLEENIWQIQRLTGQNAWFDYKNTASKTIAKANTMDYGHLRFENLALSASQFYYHPDSLHVLIENMAAIETNSGIDFSPLQADVVYKPDHIWLSNMKAKLNKSSFEGDFYMHILEPLALNMKVNSTKTYLENADLTRLVGTDMQLPHALNFKGRIEGGKGNLFFEPSHVKLGQTTFTIAGKLKNVQDAKRFAFENFAVRQGHFLAQDLMDFQPKLHLEAYLDSSAWVDLKGILKGPLQSMRAQIEGKLYEKAKNVATFGLNLQSKQLLEESRVLDFDFTSLSANGAWVQKFLPKTTLPEGKNLPDSLAAFGQFSYASDSLDVNVNTTFYRNSTSSKAELVGQVWNIKDSLQAPKLDISLNNGNFSVAEIFYWLPEAANYVQADILPKSILTAKAKGSLDDLEMSAYLDLPKASVVALIGRYKKGDLDLDWKTKNVQLSELLLETFLQKIQIPSNQELSASGGFSYFSNSKFKLNADFDKSWDAAGIHFDSVSLKSSGAILPDFSLENAHFSAFCSGLLGDIRWQTKAKLHIPNLAIDSVAALPKMDVLADLSQIRFQKDTIIQQPNPLRIYLHSDQQEVDAFRIASDWLKVEANGELDPNLVLHSIDEALAANFDLNLGKNFSKNMAKAMLNTDFKIGLYRPDFWTSGLIEGLTEMDSVVFDGKISPSDGVLQMRGILPKLAYQNISISNGSFKLLTDKKSTILAATIASMDLNGEKFMGFSGVTGKAQNQTLGLKTFTSNPAGEDRFAVNLQVNALQDSFELKFDKEQILAFQKWETNPENAILISMKNQDIGFKKVNISRDNQQLSIDGSLKQGLDIQTQKLEINPFLKLISTDLPNYYGEGTIKAKAIQKEKHLEWQANGTIEKLNDKTRTFGDLDFKTESVKDGNGLLWDAKIKQKGGFLSTKGSMDSLSYAKVNLVLDSFNLGIADPFLKEYLSDYDGVASGNAKFSGVLPNIKGSGAINIHHITAIPILSKVKYSAKNQLVLLDSSGLLFNPFYLSDEKGRIASLTGRLTNTGQLDMHIQAKNLRLLNTNKVDSSFYYGKIIADLSGNLTGPAQQPRISLELKPSEESMLNYLYDDGSASLDLGTDVVYFESDKEEEQKQIGKTEVALPYDMDVLLDMNEQLKLRAVIDKVTGDYFEGKSEGQLIYRNKANGQMYVNGTLNITEGTYRYTYNPLIKRTLEVVSGSTIQFTGDPFSPDLNLTARYRVRANLTPLLNDSGNETGANRETFFVDISIKGKTEKPDLTFAIIYPSRSTDASVSNSDNTEVEAAIANINADPAQLTQQVSSLLVLNSFVGTGTEFRVVDIAGEVQSFINSRLNALTKNVKFVDIKFGSDENQTTDNSDYTVTLEKKLLDGRLILSVEGAFGISSSTTTEDGGTAPVGSQSSLREIAAEYLLTKDKQVRIRAFSKQQTIFILQNNEQLSNGLGLFFKREFGGYK